jgi:ferredoxin
MSRRTTPDTLHRCRTDIWSGVVTNLVYVRLVLDVDRCQGHGRCYDLAPDLVGPDDDGHAVLLDASRALPPDHETTARRAVANCPERALSLGG